MYDTYVLLYQLQQHLRVGAGDEDPRLLQALHAATGQLERLTGRHFTPRRAALTHIADPRHPFELPLRDDLLDLISVENGDGSIIDPDALTVIGNGVLRSDIPLTGTVTVTAIWGWHDRWTQAWRDSGDTVQALVIDPTSTEILVTDPTDPDVEGNTPRFRVGQLLRIGSEYLRLRAINGSYLEVTRAVEDTVPAPLDVGTPIEIYTPAPQIELLTLRLAVRLYKAADGQPLPSPLHDEILALRRLRL